MSTYSLVPVLFLVIAGHRAGRRFFAGNGGGFQPPRTEATATSAQRFFLAVVKLQKKTAAADRYGDRPRRAVPLLSDLFRLFRPFRPFRFQRSARIEE